MEIGYYTAYFPYKNQEIFNKAEYLKKYSHAGGPVVAYHLAFNMAQRGHKVDIFTTAIGSKSFIENYDNINIYRYPTSFRIGRANISFKMFQEALKYSVDLVHVHSGSFPIVGLAAMRHAKRENIPLVFTYHGDVQESHGGLIRRMGISFCNKYLIDKVLSYARVIISLSENYIDESRFLRKYRDKIVVIPNGVNIEDFDIPYSKKECREKLGLPADEKIVLFFGNLVRYKGPDILVRAMPSILKEVPDTKLVFVGSGEMKGELEKLSKKLSVDRCVKFAGFVSESSKILYYKAADVFSLPSTMGPECFPIAILEAMACGIPIVASKIGGIPDIVKDGKDGLLVPPKNQKALTDSIIYLLENEDIIRKMGKNGRGKVEDYSWERIAEETEKVYTEVINGYHNWR